MFGFPPLHELTAWASHMTSTHNWNLDCQWIKVRMLPVYLLISGNFWKWQVKNMLRKSLIILNLLIWMIFSFIFHPHSGSFRSHCHGSSMVVTRLFSVRARWCNLCSACDKDSRCHVTHFPSPIKHEITSFSSVNDKLQCHGSFPKRKQRAKEAKVREEHRKRILQCQQNGIT